MSSSKYTWQPLSFDPRLWESSYYVTNFKCRSVAFEFEPGELLVFSPGCQNLETFCSELAPSKQVKYLLVPNCFHNLGLKPWQEKFPSARVFCAPEAMGRLHKLGHRCLESSETLKALLPRGSELVQTEGTRCGELWLRLGQTWIIGDAFFNYPRLSNRPIARALQRLMQAGPGLKTSSVVKYYLVKDRSQYKAWILGRLDQDQPNVLIPMHGDICQSADLTDQLRKLVLSRF